MSCKITAVIEQDEDGFFAYCPDLPGCHTQNETLEETVANLRESAELYIESLDADEQRTCLSREVISMALEAAIA